LKCVSIFEVSHPKYGSITWRDVDLTYVDLNVINLSEGMFEVYDDEDLAIIKPPIGEKLNKNAEMRLILPAEDFTSDLVEIDKMINGEGTKPSDRVSNFFDKSF
jgi:hypothetical protein